MKFQESEVIEAKFIVNYIDKYSPFELLQLNCSLLTFFATQLSFIKFCQYSIVKF